jgi:bifunctional DNase/RNase
MQEMRVVHIYSCPCYGQVMLEDMHGMVTLHIHMRPMMAHWLAHELKECQCPAISMYRSLQELLGKLVGALRLAVIDVSEENTPLGLLIIRHGGEEIHQSCHPADAVALVPLYATSRALKMGCWKSSQPWLESVTPQDFSLGECRRATIEEPPAGGRQGVLLVRCQPR